MFKFDMSIKDNFASFKDSESKKIVLIDSFDNEEFNVRMGSLEKSFDLGKILAKSSQELNDKLYGLIYSHSSLVS